MSYKYLTETEATPNLIQLNTLQKWKIVGPLSLSQSQQGFNEHPTVGRKSALLISYHWIIYLHVELYDFLQEIRIFMDFYVEKNVSNIRPGTTLITAIQVSENGCHNDAIIPNRLIFTPRMNERMA